MVLLVDNEAARLVREWQLDALWLVFEERDMALTALGCSGLPDSTKG